MMKLLCRTFILKPLAQTNIYETKPFLDVVSFEDTPQLNDPDFLFRFGTEVLLFRLFFSVCVLVIVVVDFSPKDIERP